MPANGAEALHCHFRALDPHLGVLLGGLGGDHQAVARRADFIERDAAQLARQTDGAPDLVPDPGHGGLVCSHVRPGNVLGEMADGGGEGANQLFLVGRRHRWIAEDHGLGAAMGQRGGAVLECHGTGEAKALLRAHILAHASAADGRSRSSVVDDDDGVQPDTRLVDIDNFLRSQIVGECGWLLHGTRSGSVLRAARWVRGRLQFAAMAPIDDGLCPSNALKVAERAQG